MRAGVLVSIIGHIGLVMMTMLAWEARSEMPATGGSVVPVEIVDIAEESNVRALAIPTPDDASATSPENVSPEAAPTAPAEDAPRRMTREEREYEEYLRRAGLANTDTTPAPPRGDGAPSETNRPGAGLGTAERASMEDRVRALTRAHLTRCWRMPVDLPEPERLIVTLEFDLNRNGTLNGQPRVTSPRNYTFDPPMRTAVEAALRAVRQCDPYPFPDDPAVGEHYDTWARLQFTFRPRI